MNTIPPAILEQKCEKLVEALEQAKLYTQRAMVISDEINKLLTLRLSEDWSLHHE